MPFRLRRLVPVAALALALATGCSNGTVRPVYAEGEDLFPSQTLSDWVTYSQQIAAVKIVAERSTGRDPEDVKQGAGIEGRDVHFMVERTLWKAPNFRALSESDMRAAGWRFEGAQRAKFFVNGSIRLQPGDEVVLPLTIGPDRELEILAGGAIVPLSGPLENMPSDDDLNPVVKQLRGRSLDDMATVLAAAKPDPRALPYMTLSHYPRSRMVLDGPAAPKSIDPSPSPR